MTREEYDKVKEAIEGAETSTKPFLVIDDDELVGAGDANETQVVPHDYKIRFRVPIEENGKRTLTIREVEYKDRYVTPRNDIKIVQLITELLPFYKKINPDGTITEYAEEDMWRLLTEMDQEIYDLMYDLVGTFLGIDKSIRDYMLPGDVLGAVTQILTDYQEVVNEADTFFK